MYPSYRFPCAQNWSYYFPYRLPPSNVFDPASVLSCQPIAAGPIWGRRLLCFWCRMRGHNIHLCLRCKLRKLLFIRVRFFGGAWRWHFIEICSILSDLLYLQADTIFIDSSRGRDLWPISRVGPLCSSYLLFSSAHLFSPWVSRWKLQVLHFSATHHQLNLNPIWC